MIRCASFRSQASGMLLAMAAFLGPAGSPAKGLAAVTALDRLDVLVARGELRYAEAARQKLFYLFDRTRMDPAWGAAEEPPARCGTLILAELGANLERLDTATRGLYRRYTRAVAGEGIQAPGIYETAHFHIEYVTSGPDAPPLADVSPANGVPDFVEWTGTACEHAWSVAVDTLGYTAPQLHGGPKNKYVVEYQAQDSYGYTIVVSGQRTKIVLHPGYAGFPLNDHPDGDAVGSLEITVAHELKHAIQRMYTPWNEDNWLELDASWMEDIVFDQVNDYYHRIRGAGSPFTQPSVSLHAGGAGSYEDCNWQHYQTEKLGNAVTRAFWERRREFQTEPVLTTYMETLGDAGLPFREAWGEFVAWNVASGARAAGYGYGEAASYPTPPASSTHYSVPVPTTSGRTNPMAATIHLVPNPDAALAGTPEFAFSGYAAPGVEWGVSVVFQERAGAVSRVPMALVGGAATVALSSHDWRDLEWAALVVGNATIGGPPWPYSFSIGAIAPILIGHERAWNTANSSTPHLLKARVTAGTAAPDPSSVALHYRVDGGPSTTVAMESGSVADEYAASIPAQPVGSTIEYRISARSLAGDPASSPALPGGFYRFQAVSVFEPFEAEGGWAVGDTGDDATGGGWELAQPVGTIAAPYEDSTIPPGTRCYLTQNGTVGGSASAADVDGGRTTLLSPVFEFWTGRPYLRAEARYRRWYSNHIGGLPDDAWRVDVSNDGGTTWTNLETVIEGENAWVPVTVDLLAQFGGPDRVRVRFVAEDRGAASLVEAGVDDFEIVAVLQNPLDIAPPSARGVELGPAWPNPSRAAVSLRLVLPVAANVEATVRDLQGRSVRSLVPPGTLIPAGPTVLVWDGLTEARVAAPPGLYLCEVLVSGRRCSRKVALLR